MRVDVDDAGHERKAAGVEGFARRFAFLDRNDPAVLHPDVENARRRAGAVDD
jgi:hypothetical protein